MINVEYIETWGFEHAIRGMRNPMNSWDRIDSYYETGEDPWDYQGYIVGNKDLTLMKKLYKAGTEHRKYLRQIFVSMDVVAPFYWWKEFDTYKVGTVSNSCSTMHKIAAKEFELDDFSHEHLGFWLGTLENLVDELNVVREFYIKTKDKKYWWQMIQLLPSSYNQRRTVTMTYENVVSMIKQRDHHKLDEWNTLVSILRELPYIEEIME